MALAHYYALQLWKDYLEAKAQWEHAHAEYISAPIQAKNKALLSLNVAWRNMDDLLIQLRATPEHKAAFGW